jgi:AcrR family transcriptional regulator
MEPERARRTQAERRQTSERALLGAAAEVIAERGIGGASFAAIGDRAGTSRGLANHRFGTKDALVARVAADAQERVLEAMAEASLSESAPGRGPMSGLELIRVWVNTYLELFEDPTPDLRALIVMWGSIFPSESSLDGILEADRRSYEGWATNIREGQRDGSIRDDVDPAASAVVLHGLLRGVAALMLTEAQYTDTDMARVRVSVDIWLEGALATQPVSRLRALRQQSG